MDDGHQNFSLAKDLSLVVVDAETGFGNRRVLPAGPLREPVGQGLARADAVIVSGEGSGAGLGAFKGPVLRCRLVHDGNALGAGARVVAFAGIGRPAKFFASLEALGARIVESRAYGDHHIYTQSEMARLKARARAEDAILVTTEKDFVRLTPAERDGILPLPAQTIFADGPALEALLDRLNRPALPPKAS